ncbi:MAG: cobalamin-binding protein [Candidatus Lokiarchaeota archaeon]|nr:cobalamin-binding protein [Candidatus Lokiarchaeota archaeon]MBD3199925.1 cobalamin-binding protein [Candidatus Lokiarchaeota archaeon]
MEEITKAIVDLDEDKVLKLVKDKLDAGEDPLEILEAGRKGMSQIGEESGEGGSVFLTDLIMAGEIFREVMEVLMPKLADKSTESKGKIVIGTVQGDIHNIGKDIVITFLEAEGFEVIDLGVDVPPEKFVESIKENNPEIVGLSGLLTLSIEPMKKTIETIEGADLRSNLKVIVGGERMDQEVSDRIGADAWVNDASEGVKIIKKWVEGG